MTLSYLPFGADIFVLEFINKTLHAVFLNYFFVFFSDERAAVFPLVLTLFFFLRKYNKKGIVLFLFAIAAVGLSDLLGARIFKELFDRPRPCQEIAGIFYFDKKTAGWLITDGVTSFKSSSSFVSNHSANAAAFALFSSFYLRRLSVFFLTGAFLVGISRIYTGIHYPSDVAAGFATGAVCAFFTKWLFDLSIKIHSGYREKRKKVRS